MTTETTTIIESLTETMMSAYNAYGRNHDDSQTERLLAEYRTAAAGLLAAKDCGHEYVEYDERQVAVDHFVSEATGTCEDCGQRVEWVEDWDEDGRTWYLSEIEGA